LNPVEEYLQKLKDIHSYGRIAAILLLERELDANYLAVKADTYTWKR
jgi:hypothetical protein